MCECCLSPEELEELWLARRRGRKVAEPEYSEMRDLRGFSMRRGRWGRILRMARPAAATRRAGRAVAFESSVLILPGRNLFSRRAGNYHHVERCGMCRPGRRQGAGGKKSSKKCSAALNCSARDRWLEVVREARAAKAAGLDGADEPQPMPLPRAPIRAAVAAPPPPSSTVALAPMMLSSATAPAAPKDQEGETVKPPPPPPVAALGRVKMPRRRRGSCLCCAVGSAGAVASAKGSHELSEGFVIVSTEATFGKEWLVV
mmetsp:Transcript_116905/g.377278  ORF Transcript_116905/g.377278 Transcript_116905/m.377278 type:complete len:259 (+) Transcript_116905:114-890(+)